MMINGLNKKLLLVLMGHSFFLFATPSNALAEKVIFRQAGNSLVAHYLLPKANFHKGVIIFVHGDGPMNYEADGYYPLIWNYLRAQGYAIFSWSKAGIGGSSDHWLNQSMLDRQIELRAAIQFLRDKYKYRGTQIGLLGFSQAGWVIPAVANNNPDVGFVVGIGFAMDWFEQGWYLTKTRLIAAHRSPAEIEIIYKTYIEDFTFLQKKLSYKTYLQRYRSNDHQMSEQRYGFVLKNLNTNAYADYKGIQQPMLILLGEHDLNIDIKDTQTKLLEIFHDQSNVKISIIPNASHGMLKSKNFNQQVPGFLFWLKLMWMRKSALSPDFLTVLSDWIDGLELKSSDESTEK